MPDNTNPSGSPLTRKKYTAAFKAEYVRQVAAGGRQTDVVCGLRPVARFAWPLAAPSVS